MLALDAALPVHAGHLTAIMLRACNAPDELAQILTDRRHNAVALGPALGVGEATRRFVAAALSSGASVVLDADALTSFERQASRLADLIGARPLPPIVTPHTGEFARLFAGVEDQVGDPSKLERTRRAAALLGAIVVL